MKPPFRWLLFAVFSFLFLNSASAHYDPRHGRWISRDPLGEAGGFNLYAYCGNDPVNRHDPLGLQTPGTSFTVPYAEPYPETNFAVRQNYRPETSLRGGYGQNRSGSFWEPIPGQFWIANRDVLRRGIGSPYWYPGMQVVDDRPQFIFLTPIQLQELEEKYGPAPAMLSEPSTSTDWLSAFRQRTSYERFISDYYSRREIEDWFRETEVDRPAEASPNGGAAIPRLGQQITSGNIFYRTVNFTPSTGNTYRVFQRADINWSFVRTLGPVNFIGRTNAEAARQGYRPQLSDGSFVTIHHSQQSALGPWFEASTRYHNIRNAQSPPLHPYGGQQHPDYPLGRGPGSLREQFQEIEAPEYWIWREMNRDTYE